MQLSARRQPRRHRAVLYPAAAAVLVFGLLAPTPASASRAQDPQAERDSVRAQQAMVIAGLGGDKTTMGQVDTALQALDRDTKTQERLLGEAERAELRATRRANQADQAVARMAKQQAILRKAMARRSVVAFMNPSADGLFSMLRSQDINDAVNHQMYVEVQAQTDAQLAEHLRTVNRELESERRQASHSRSMAARKRIEQRRTLATLGQARAATQKMAAAIQASIDAKLLQTIKLAETDKALSMRIALEQGQLAARLLSLSGQRSPVGGLSTVGGITVSSQIAFQLGAMLGAAQAAGVLLTGSGYRTPAQQIELRKQHCGTSYDAIYLMSPSACSPPTARPGSSMHEIGLAIDFANCNAHSTVCFVWLSANAARFGFHNLASEPWHWSVNGG
ncbi:MAG: mannose-binding lectin [Acidimicrobiales bacterium]|nr:mannose-binding lectin [Acidimicrobiales bacterium]